MRGNQITSKQNLNIELPRPYFPQKRSILGIGAGVLVIGLLAISLFFAPEAAVYGLAGIGIGLPLLLLVWFRPEFGLLAVVFLAMSLIRADIIDLRLPIGGLELRDLVLIGMLGLLILQGLIHTNLTIPWWHVGAPLLVFLGLAFVSTLYALFFQHVKPSYVFSELRALIFYSVFFVTGWAITNRRQLETALAGLFILADLLAGVIILQQFLGVNHPLFAAMSYNNWSLYEVQQTGGAGGFGTVRIMPPGVVLIYFMIILAFCLIVFTPHNWRLRNIFVLQLVFLSFGLLLTYTRALWIATVCALGFVLLALLPTYKAYLIRYFMIGLPLLCLLFGLMGTISVQSISGSPMATAFVERVLSIVTPEETLGSDSLQWRIFETEQGLRSVSENPLVGVGLGNSYRAITTLQGEARGIRTGYNLAAGKISSLTRFLHNSYLFIAVKMGIPALACFLWFCAALVVKSGQLYRNLPKGQSRGIVLAVLASFVGLMLWSVLHQHFVQTESTAIVGLMAGLAASLRRWSDGHNDLLQPSHRASVRLHS